MMISKINLKKYYFNVISNKNYFKKQRNTTISDTIYICSKIILNGIEFCISL
jgi:hypothetical protein